MANAGYHHHHFGGHDPAPTPPGPPTPPSTPTPSPVDAPDFAQLGATFNDATRALVGGLWQNTVEEGGQGLGNVSHYVSDLQTVQQGLVAEINAGQFSGTALQDVNTILNDIATATNAATASVSGGGAFGSVAAAETALHDSHLDILNIVNNDPTLQALATQNGASGFLAAPPTLPDGVTAETAPHANFAEIGAIFNDLANQIVGGVNADNKAALTNDVNALVSDLQGLINANPLQFGGLTGIHAETIVNQLELENQFINEAGVTPDAGRASNDNILDIIDIVQGDTNLANMANQDGVAGWQPFGDALNPTPKYMDNDSQTTFWATFIAQSNSLGQQGTELVGSGNTAAINALIGDLHSFQKYVTNFDAAQGGIFEARFDNELLGNTSTLGAEVTAMIKGLQTGNAALVSAAAEEMHANAADVSGNNVPNGGGTYNPDGLTVAEALSTAGAAGGAAVASANVAPAATAAGAGAAGETAAAVANVASNAAGANAGHAAGAPDFSALAHEHQMPMHFAHMWG